MNLKSLKRNKSELIVFILADNYNLSGVDVNEETKCYISKEK